MENEIIEATSTELPAIADDTLIYIARAAEARIDAVIKIKQLALKVTNAYDWTDQGGKPYLQASGSEKIANLFGISWRINEPSFEEEADGHYTYYYRGQFSMSGRSIEVDGSRGTKDPFFKKYDWIDQGPGKDKKKTERPITSIDRGDVRKAAMTNLLGNGITRLLGIRNLTWDDLEKFAGIRQDQVGKIDYESKGKNKPPINPPQSKSASEKPAEQAMEAQGASVTLSDIQVKKGEKNGKKWTRYGIKDSAGIFYNTFDAKFFEIAKEALSGGIPVKIEFVDKGKFGKDLTAIDFNDAPNFSDAAEA